jgi:hypothetical protein
MWYFRKLVEEKAFEKRINGHLETIVRANETMIPLKLSEAGIKSFIITEMKFRMKFAV